MTPDVLSPETLFRLFLTWTDEDTLRTCQNPDDKQLYFSQDVICRTLDCYFKDYRFDITRCESYDAQSGMVVLPTASVNDGALDMRFYGKKQNGDMVTYAVDFTLLMAMEHPNGFLTGKNIHSNAMTADSIF